MKSRKGQNLIMVAAIAVLAFIAFGFVLMFAYASVSISGDFVMGSEGSEIGSVKGDIATSFSGAGMEIGEESSSREGEFSVVQRNLLSPLKEETGFSSSTYSALQIPQMVLYSSTEDGRVRDEIIEFLHCRGKEGSGCNTAPSREEMKEVLNETINSYTLSSDTSYYPYNVVLGGSEGKILELDRMNRSETANITDRGMTSVSLPLPTPGKGEHRINLTFRRGNIQVTAGYE